MGNEINVAGNEKLNFPKCGGEGEEREKKKSGRKGNLRRKRSCYGGLMKMMKRNGMEWK